MSRKLSKEKLQKRKEIIFSSVSALRFISKTREKFGLNPRIESIPPIIGVCILNVSTESGFFLYSSLENLFILESYKEIGRRKLTRLCGGKFGKAREVQTEMNMRGIIKFHKSRIENKVSVSPRMKYLSPILFPNGRVEIIKNSSIENVSFCPNYINFFGLAR